MKGVHRIHFIFRNLKLGTPLCVIGENIVADPVMNEDVMGRPNVKQK